MTLRSYPTEGKAELLSWGSCGYGKAALATNRAQSGQDEIREAAEDRKILWVPDLQPTEGERSKRWADGEQRPGLGHRDLVNLSPTTLLPGKAWPVQALWGLMVGLSWWADGKSS